LFETCLKLVWNLFETCLKLVWNLFETCLKLVWNVFETCLKRVWNLFETWLKLVWKTLGVNEGMNNPPGAKIHPWGPTNVVKNCLQDQGCQMVYFETKYPNLCKFWSALKRNILTYFKAMWNIFRPFGRAIWKFNDNSVYFTPFWYVVSRQIWQPLFKIGSTFLFCKTCHQLQENTLRARDVLKTCWTDLGTGLPDFSRHNIPKWRENMPNYNNIAKWP
jgi:hypothetical protein